MNAYKLLLCGILIAMATICRAQGLQDTSKQGEFYGMLDHIRMIMQGAPYEQVKQYASSEGMVISGDSIRHLIGVLKGKERAAVLGEDSTREGVQVMARSNKGEDAIYVVLKTVSARKDDPHYHSLVLYKEPETGWQIYLWHVGL